MKIRLQKRLAAMLLIVCTLGMYQSGVCAASNPMPLSLGWANGECSLVVRDDNGARLMSGSASSVDIKPGALNRNELAEILRPHARPQHPRRNWLSEIGVVYLPDVGRTQLIDDPSLISMLLTRAWRARKPPASALEEHFHAEVAKRCSFID